MTYLAAINVVSGTFLQIDTDPVFGVNTKLFLVFTALIVVAVLLQAIVLVVMAVGANKTQKKMLAIAEDLQAKAGPILDSTRRILDDTAPKVKIISTNIVETSHLLRANAENLSRTVEDIATRVRMQTERVDGMVSTSLTGVNEVVAAVQRGVMAPVRQIQGMLNGLRAGLDVLRSKVTRTNNSSADEDMFI